MSMNRDAVKPVTPKEAGALKQEMWERNLPPPVLEAINEAIIAEHEERGFTVTQEQVMTSILKKMKEGRDQFTLDDTNCPWYYKVTRQGVFDHHWLDFEKMFEKAGWKVEFDKPGYNENYNAFWRFSKKK